MAQKLDIHAELTASSGKFTGAFKEASKTTRDFGKDYKAAMDPGAGFFDKAALQAKKMKREKRSSGEAALQGLLNNPADALMDIAGMGVQGFIADKVGSMFAKSTETMLKFQSGETPANQMVNDLAHGIPILGQFVQGWQNVFSLIDGSAKEARELNLLTKEGELGKMVLGVATGARRQLDLAQTNDALGRELLSIEKDRLEGVGKAREAMQKLAPSEEEISARSGWGGLGNQSPLIFSTNRAAGWLRDKTGIPFDVEGVEAPQMKERERIAQKIMSERGNAKRAAEQAEADAFKTAAVKRTESIAKANRAVTAEILGLNMGRLAGGDPGESLKARQAVRQMATQSRVAEIDLSLQDKTLAPERRKKIEELRQATIAEGEAAVTDMAVREARRRESSLLGIEHDIALNRLAILKATALDANAIWLSTEGSMKEDTRAKLAALDEQLKAINLTEAERNKLLEQRQAITQADPAVQARALLDFRRAVLNERAGIAGGLEGGAASLLGQMTALGGGTWASQRLQKELAARMFGNSLLNQGQGVLDNPKASAGQKEAARHLQKLAGKYTEFATSKKVLDLVDDGPLRFAAGEDVSGGRFGGGALGQYEGDLGEMATAKSEVQKTLNDMLDEIRTLVNLSETKAQGLPQAQAVQLSTLLDAGVN